MMPDSNVLGKPLTVLQRRFCELYNGNGVEAARKAGYKGDKSALAAVVRRNLQNPRIFAIIQKRKERDADGNITFRKENITDITEEEEDDIASKEERQRFWTCVMRGYAKETIYTRDGKRVTRTPKMADRLRASELLAKSQCDFIERRIIIDKTPIKKIQIELVRPGENEKAVQTEN